MGTYKWKGTVSGTWSGNWSNSGDSLYDNYEIDGGLSVITVTGGTPSQVHSLNLIGIASGVNSVVLQGTFNCDRFLMNVSPTYWDVSYGNVDAATMTVTIGAGSALNVLDPGSIPSGFKLHKANLNVTGGSVDVQTANITFDSSSATVSSGGKFELHSDVATSGSSVFAAQSGGQIIFDGSCSDGTVKLSATSGGDILIKSGLDLSGGGAEVDGTSWIEIGDTHAAVAGDFLIDDSQTVKRAGSITAPNLKVNGALTVSGPLTLTGAATTSSTAGALSGSGAINFGDHASLTLKNLVAAATSPKITFATDDVLTLGTDDLTTSGAFLATLDHFNATDSINLGGVTVSSANYSGDLLTLYNGTNAVSQFTMTDVGASPTFIVQNGVITLSTTGVPYAVNTPNSVVAGPNAYVSVPGVSVYEFTSNPNALGAVTVTATYGALKLGATAGVVSGSGTTTLTISNATLAEINADLATLQYDDTAGQNAKITVTFGPDLKNADASASVAVVYDALLPSVTISSTGGLVGSRVQTVKGSVGVIGAGLTVSIYDGSSLVGQAVADSAGAWSTTALLSQGGNNVLTAKATDSAKNTAVSTPVTFDVIETVQDFLAAQSAIDLQSQSFALKDTAANVAKAIDTLNSDSHVASITLTDAGTPVLNLKAGQPQQDAALLTTRIANTLFEVNAGGGLTYYVKGANVKLSQSNTNLNLLAGASVTLTGGANTLNFGAGAVATLVNTHYYLDTVNATGGKVYLSNAEAKVIGGGNAIVFQTPNGSVNLQDTGANADTVTANGNILTLQSAQATVIGGGDTIQFENTGNSLTLKNTGSAADTISGGYNSIFLQSAQATIYGPGESITFQTGVNAVTLNSTAGVWDTVTATTRGTVNLEGAQANVVGGGNTIASIAGWAASSVALDGTAGVADTLTGAFGQIILGGLHGAAQAVVNGGGQTITLQNGTDSVTLANTAGAFDTVSQAASAVAGNITVNNAQANIVGTGYAITLTGTGDVVNLSGGGDTVRGSNSQINLNAAQATVSGNSNTINLTGGAATKAIVLGASNAVSVADGGAATVSGNSNTIAMTGGAATVAGNTNTFVFAAAFGKDTITGFNATDTIQLAAADFANWNALLGHMTQSGSSTLITLDASNVITLAGVNKSTLTSSEFSFH